MLPSGFVVFASVSVCVLVARAADATSRIEYTQRNTPFAPGASVEPSKQTPAANEAVQNKRVPTTTIDKPLAPLGDRRAPVEMKETRDKQVREKDSYRPEGSAQPTSAYHQRQAAISTAGNTSKPPIVSKYQDSLAAASATNMARFPAMDRATTARINRFVFRKNPAETPVAAGGAAVTPAAGGSVIRK
jgi:hypothetical protein